jgi:hypothetical protein
VDALRGVCEELVKIIPDEFWEKLNEAEEFDQLEALPDAMRRYIDSLKQWTKEDQPLPEDSKIEATHPTKTNEHQVYAEALRLVGAKRSKYALVDLVNWLLIRLEVHERQNRFLKK